ncbi:histidine kinase [Actinomadura pelletieri DSM 43383]|uniref:histidine kinase n=1 Tax=Actinomadura pelletieri DSM 43383 TaxID=1120940 RepID=A0A495R008_9ACTN|nr:sensor histidine kinase [Actinomadura pelletieri]RKS79648.1 histidine kinase [Actinomadura pelletieri DSM 43383]
MSVLLVAGAVQLMAVDGRWGLMAKWGWWTTRSLVLGVFFAVAAAVVLHTGRRGLGAVLSVTAVSMGVYGLGGLLHYTADGAGAFLAPGPRALMRGAAIFGMHGSLAVLPLWFPQGHLPHPRWRWPVIAMVVVYLLYLAPLAWFGWQVTDQTWTSGALGEEHPWWGRTGHAIIWMPRLLSIVVLAQLVRGFDRADGLAGRQLRAMACGYGLYWGTQIFDKLIDIGDERDLPLWAHFLFNGPLALALAVITIVAMLRDDLTAFDRSLRRALVLFGLVIGLAYAYKGLYMGFSALPPNRTATSAVVLAALIALALRPAAGLLLKAGDLLLYGRRAKPVEMLRALATGLRDRMPAEAVPSQVCRIVVERMGLPAATLVAHTRQGDRELARAGTPDDGSAVMRTELTYQGDPVGCLTVHLRPGQRTLDSRDQAALEIVTDQLGPIVSAIGLHEELRISRERIVVAREEERRRLRRDLHDGLGPCLAGIQLHLDTAADLLRPGSPPRGLVEAACGAASGGLSEVRRIIDDLRPPDLDEHGLVAALQLLVTRLGGPTLTITATFPDSLPELSAATETAVYRIAAEALTNVVRHARATTAALTLTVDDTHLVMRIVDDGVRLPDPPRRAGVGLTSMAERAEEIGGSCRVSSRQDGPRGTLVDVRLPKE